MGRGYVKHRAERAPDQASEAQVQAMNAKLAARVGCATPIPAIAQPSEAVRSPKEKSALEWEKPAKDAMGLKTKCGRYSCAKIVIDGAASYELWKLAPGAGWFRQLNKGLDNFLQVQKLAQIDADKEMP